MSFPTAQLRRLALTPPYRRTLKHHLTLATIFVFAFATYIGHAFSDGREQPLEIHARKLLNGLRNNQELRPKDIGSEHLQGALGNNQAEPRSLAAADFDEDGVPDLVSGYVSGKKGIVSLRRGNIDSIYPNTPEANQRRLTGESSSAPFLSPAHLFETPFVPNFLGAGDFNADGHWDIVLAARGIAFLSILSGDGRGNFGETKKIGLPGNVTALITGEINRADGLTDVVVAINGESGPQALVFEGPSGALKATPESFSLPAPATSLALGQLSSAYTIDLAIASGAELLVIYGRDRKLTLTTEQQNTVAPARIERRQFSGAVKSLAIANFDDQPQSDIAALTEGGEVHLLSRLGKRRPQAKAMPVANWENRSVMSAFPGAERLIVANVSTLPADDLLLLDSTDRQLRVLQPARRTEKTLDTLLGRPSEQEKLSLALEGAGTIAVLPMQLDVDALTDLVVLRQNEAEPVFLLTAPVMSANSGLPAVSESGATSASNDSWVRAASAITPQKPQTQFSAGTKSTLPVKNRSKESRTLRPLGSCPSSPIAVGQTINGALATTDCFLDDGNYVDVYTFTGTVGQQISITLNSAAFDAYLYLLRPPNNSLLSSDDDGGDGTNAQIPTAGGFITLPADGIYTIYATSFEAEETGPYALTLTAPGGGQCPPTQIARGQTINGTLTTNDCIIINDPDRNGAFVDTYAFTGFAGQQVAVAMSSNNFDTYLYAFPPSGQPVLEDDDGGGGTNSRIPPSGTVILPENGVYTIFATSFAPGATGAYTITLIAPLLPTEVINTNDSGPGSLRQAILNANDNEGEDTITFSIGSGAQTINVGSTTGLALPEITDPVTIDGTTQEGFSGTPLIELNGQFTPQGTAGLKITAGSSRVRGLVINRFGVSDCDFPLNVAIDSGSGIVLASEGNNIIEGNFLGTDLTGTIARCNSGNGVFVLNSSNNTIGGTTVAARNVISGNRLPGIGIGGEFSTGNQVQGNFIGTNVTGTGDLGNRSNGLVVINGTSHVIGGTVAGAGNLISGNDSPGVALGFSDPAGILVQGNFVGTNIAGTAAIPNLGGGIIVGGFFQLNGDPITATDNTIGGTTPIAGNVISGNLREPGDFNLDAGNGVEIINEGSQDNKVQGNFIGLNAAGTAVIPNAGSGVFITRAPNNFIGGVFADIEGTTNYIAGNGRYGVGVGIRRLNESDPGQFITGGDAVDIVFNVIGTDPTQTLRLGNGLDGVYVDADSVDIYVNSNVIAFNGRSGVRIPDANGVPGDDDNSGRTVNLDLNYIFSNAGRAVDLGVEGLTDNDPLDVDRGANLQQNFPDLTSSSIALHEDSPPENPASAAAVNVTGTLNSSPNSTYTVHWYFSNDAQCTAGQAGSRPLVTGRIPNVNTNAAGSAPFTIALDFPAGVNSGIVNCSATDPQGNTSEYSSCFAVTADPTPPSMTIQFSNAAASVTETVNATTKVDLTVTRSGNTSAPATVNYASANGSASDFSDYLAALGTLNFAAGEASKIISVFIVDDAFGESAETFTVSLSNPVGASLGTPSTFTVTINSNEVTNGPNPVRDATFSSDFFVRQHYVDFFNRAADPPGLGFWKNQIDECTTQACREIRRINVSAAFFVSIEFQQTGYLVYRAYQAAFNSGERLDLRAFLPDTQEIGRGVVIGQPGADQQLEINKQNFFLNFVQRPAFLAVGAYPTTLPADQFVDKLNSNTFDPRNPGAGALTPSERQALIDQLAPNPSSATLRAQVLRSVSENGVFNQRQFNKAFVLMQYFGYLRRNPNAAPDSNFDGYNFWLGKLNQFNGNFVDAEMVKAFITSGEYIQRFGP